MRITKIYWRRFSSPVAFATGLLLGAFALFLKYADLPDPVPVEAVHPTIDEPVVSAEVISPAVERLRSMYISGSMQTRPNEVELEFRSPDNPDRYYMTGDLRQMGVDVIAHGTCYAELHLQGVTVPVSCLAKLSM